MKYEIVKRGGRFAVVRVLPSGDAAGYDAVADRNNVQKHFQIHRGTADATAVDMAFDDSRKYASYDDAFADASKSFRCAE
jgi:hypothetical protein